MTGVTPLLIDEIKAALGVEDPKPAQRYVGDTPAEYPEGDDLPAERYARYNRALWDEQEGGLEPLHRVWIQNLLMLLGHQHWEFDRMAGSFRPKRVPSYRELTVTNLLLPYFKHVLAKATKNRPAYRSIAASTDPEDLHAAALSDDVLRAKWEELRLGRNQRRGIAWAIPTGNAYFLPYWNTDTGRLRPLTVPVEAVKYDADTGEMVGVDIVECPCDVNGEPLMRTLDDGRQVYDLEAEPAWIDEGEVGERVLSPFQVRVDPSAETDEDVTWVIIGEALMLREIRRRWPHLSDKLTADDLGLLGRYEELVTGLSTGADTHAVGGAADRTEEAPKALVLHYHERPSPEYPNGRYWVTVGDQLAEPPQELPDGIWPVVHHLKEIEIPGRYHGGSTFEAAVGLQREYNDVNGLIKEHHNLMLRGKWLVPIGSNIRRGQITQMPGEVIQHTPGLPPKMADLKPLPQQVYQERERILADLERVTGIHKISMGTPPPGVTSGRAFLTLQEADDTDLGPFLEQLEEITAARAWSMLQIIQRRYVDERLIYVVGPDRSYQVRAFKGADLSGVVDVVPQAGSSHPWSQVARQNMLIEIAQAFPFLFEDPDTGGFDRHRLARLLPIAGIDSLYEYEDIDVNEALREEEQFELWDGVDPAALPRVQPWQNHQIHDRQHTRVLKSAAFQQWHPHAQQAFLHHWRETRQAIQEMALAQMAEAAAAQGAVIQAAGGGDGRSGSGNHPMERPELTDAEAAAGGLTETQASV